MSITYKTQDLGISKPQTQHPRTDMHGTSTARMKALAIAITTLCTAFAEQGVLANGGEVQRSGRTTVLVTPDQDNSAASNVLDYENAKPMPMPEAATPSFEILEAGELKKMGTPGSAKGGHGDGKTNPVRLVPREKVKRKDTGSETNMDDIVPLEFGTSNLPYTTSRVDLSSNTVSKLYPYRAAGKLFFNKPDGTYVCSASLIKKGLVVTAAHCVANFGTNRYYSNWTYVPAYYDGFAPYGAWTAQRVRVLTSYLNGTDPCAAGNRGVVCKNDIAVISLAPQSGRYPGNSTGWYGYGWDGYGFTGSSFSTGAIALLNQLGYPSSHDGGNRMQRTDAQGSIGGASLINNIIWGTRQTGGSSGGPELVNLGVPAVLGSGVGYGAEAAFNTVVGVTSWGSASKQVGASPFLSSNIVKLVNDECAGGNPACAP